MNANVTPESVSARQKITGLLANRPDICKALTDAQLQVVDLLVQGHSAPTISRMIGRSSNTVHDHIKAIYKKLQVTKRVQLVLLFTQPVTAGGGA